MVTRVGTRPAGSPRSIPEIESLRGLAIALVFVMHVESFVHGGQTGAIELPLVRSLVLAGHTGVSLFFVLSAFLLARPFLAAARDGSSSDTRGYLLRRALRIMPIYAFAVLVAAVITARDPAHVLRALPYLCFLQAVPGATTRMWPFSDVWWSLATEAQFYALLPLLTVALRSRRGRMVGGASVLVYVAAYVSLATGWLSMPSLGGQLALAHSLVGRGPLFAAGILAAVLYDGSIEHRPRRGPPARASADLVLLGALGGLALLLRWSTLAPYTTREALWPTWHAAEGALWAVVLLALVRGHGYLKPLLANPLWSTLGLLSYSIYLVHFPVIVYGRKIILSQYPGTFPWLPQLRPWTFTGIASAMVLAAVVIAISAVTYAGIERPALRLKSRLGRRRRDAR